MKDNNCNESDSVLAFRCPRSFAKAIDEAASLRLQSKSDYIRQAALQALKADGVNVA